MFVCIVCGRLEANYYYLSQILCHSTTTFIGHLVNQSLAHEIVALQILVLLLERPTDDSVEIAVGFMREVGAFLAENSPKANASVYERFRVVLNEGTISQRVQFMVEVLMQVRKDKYKDNPILPEGLDLVPEEDQITHQVALEDDLQVQEGLSACFFSFFWLELFSLRSQIYLSSTLIIQRMRKNTVRSRRRSLVKMTQAKDLGVRTLRILKKKLVSVLSTTLRYSCAHSDLQLLLIRMVSRIRRELISSILGVLYT